MSVISPVTPDEVFQLLVDHRRKVELMKDDCEELLLKMSNKVIQKSVRRFCRAFEKTRETLLTGSSEVGADLKARHRNYSRRHRCLSEQQPESEQDVTIDQDTFQSSDEDGKYMNEIQQNRERFFAFLGGDASTSTREGLPADLYCLFGGQGYDNIRELRDLLNDLRANKQNSDLSSPIVDAKREFFSALISGITRILAIEVEAAADLCSEHGYPWRFDYGLDIDSWLASESKPGVKPGAHQIPSWYLFSAPVSYPLTLVVQFLRYLEFLLDHGLTQAEAVELVSAASGHSQGLHSAVVISISTTTTQLFENFVAFLRLTIYQGLRCHVALCEFSKQVMGESIDLQAFYASGSSNDNSSHLLPDCSPMASIKGLSLDEVNDCIRKVNLHYASEQGSSKEVLYLGLVNGHELFVVCGLPCALLDLRDLIERESTTKKTSVFFLKAGAAFHAPMNDLAISQLLLDASRLGILDIHGSALQFPVFGTRAGENLQRSEHVMQRLIKLQAVEMLDYYRTVQSLIANTTLTKSVILDFGPGDGSAKLCRNILVEPGGSTRNKELRSLKAGVETVVMCTAGKMRGGKLLDGSLIGIDMIHRVRVKRSK